MIFFIIVFLSQCAPPQAPLKAELPPQRLRGCGRYLRFYKTLGEFVQSPLASPGGKLARPNGA